MKKKKKGQIFKQERSRTFKYERYDVNREKQKYPENTQCPSCGLLYLKGRWVREETDFKTNKVLCPACRRIKDNYPAGLVELSGPFLDEHHAEIMHLVKNLEQK